MIKVPLSVVSILSPNEYCFLDLECIVVVKIFSESDTQHAATLRRCQYLAIWMWMGYQYI